MKDFNEKALTYYEELKGVYEQNETLKKDLDEDRKQLFVKENEVILNREIIKHLENENFFLRELLKCLVGVKK